MVIDFQERFWSKVAIADEAMCWIWQAGRNAYGYGGFGTRSLVLGAHTVAWELSNRKPIPTGMLVLHHCDTPACVNPSHIYLGTAADNIRDALERDRIPQALATHCVHGHSFDDANTYRRPSGGRDCRACGCERTRRYNERQRIGVAA